MRFNLIHFRTITLIILAALIVTVLPLSAHAQTRLVPGPVMTTGVKLARIESLDRSRMTQDRPREKKSAIGWSITAGMIAGAAAAAYGAQLYGENESGGFCSRCFLQWGAVAVPVGAGVGALAGVAINAARR